MEKGCGLTVKRIALPARPPTLLTSGDVGSVSLRLLENNARGRLRNDGCGQT